MKSNFVNKYKKSPLVKKRLENSDSDSINFSNEILKAHIDEREEPSTHKRDMLEENKKKVINFDWFKQYTENQNQNILVDIE